MIVSDCFLAVSSGFSDYFGPPQASLAGRRGVLKHGPRLSPPGDSIPNRYRPFPTVYDRFRLVLVVFGGFSDYFGPSQASLAGRRGVPIHGPRLSHPGDSLPNRYRPFPIVYDRFRLVLVVFGGLSGPRMVSEWSRRS